MHRMNIRWLSRRKELKCNEDFALGSSDGTEDRSDVTIALGVCEGNIDMKLLGCADGISDSCDEGCA